MWLRLSIIIFILLHGLSTSQAQTEPGPVWADGLLPLDSGYPNQRSIYEPASVHLEPVAKLGRGTANGILWNPETNEIVVIADDGVWTYDATNIHASPRYLDIPSQQLGNNQTTLSYRQTDNNVLEVYNLYTGDMAFTTSFEIIEGFRFQTVTPDGSRIIFGQHAWATPFQGLELWDTATSRRIPLMPQESAGAYNHIPIITSDSRYMIGLASEYIRVWDLHDGSLKAEYTSQISELWKPASLHLHPNNNMLILTREGDPFEVWDLRSGLPSTIDNPHTEWIQQIVFSDDGKLMATHDISDRVVIWNSMFEVIGEFMLDPDFSHFVINHNKHQIAAVSKDHRLRLISLQDGAIVATTAPHSLDAGEMYRGNMISVFEDQVHIRDLRTNQLIWQTKLEEDIVTMAAMPFRTMNALDAVVLGTGSGQLYAVLQVPATVDAPIVHIPMKLPSPHPAGVSITHVTALPLREESQEILYNNEVTREWMQDNFISLDENNQLVFWKVRSIYKDDDYSTKPEYVFTPVFHRQLFSDSEINTFHIDTHNGYLAVATSDGMYLWDIAQLILEEDTVPPILHLRDPFQPNVRYLVWLDETRLAYGGDNGVVTIIHVDDPTYNAQWQTGLTSITTMAAFESLLFAGGCAETKLMVHVVELMVYTRCASYGFGAFYTKYDSQDETLVLSSPVLLQIQDRTSEVERFLLYWNAILIDSDDGTVEVWGVPGPDSK